MLRMSLIGVLLISSGCGKVEIRDHEVCGDKGELGASCFHMLSDRSRKLTKGQWELERFGQLCMKAEAYANFKEALLKLCQKTGRCSFEEIKQIEAIGDLVETFEKEISHAKQLR